MIKKLTSVLYLLLTVYVYINVGNQQYNFVDLISDFSQMLFLISSFGDAFKLNLGERTNWQRIWVTSLLYNLGYVFYLDHRYGAQHNNATTDLLGFLVFAPIIYMSYHFAFARGSVKSKDTTSKVKHKKSNGLDEQTLDGDAYIIVGLRKLKAVFSSDWDLPPTAIVRELEVATIKDPIIEKSAADELTKPLAYTLTKTRFKTKRKPFLKRKSVWAVCVILIILVISGPVSDAMTIQNADPSIKSLAEQAGMSRKGELLFLRASPKIDTDAQIEIDCSSNAAANNSNGFIEQGCYDPQSNRIYIRQMPQDLASMEVATAAYEMLHIVYIQQVNQGNGSPLNKSIEANYSSINDTFLNTQVANFAKTEPSYRELELFSLLGTGYNDLTPDMAYYYQPYFKNIQNTIDANNQVTQLFQNDENQLTQLNQTYNADVAKANSDLATANNAYYDSTTWAGIDQSQEDYNYNIYLEDYNIYSSDIDSVNQNVDSYNSLLNVTNNLITEFNGQQPVSTLQNADLQQKSSQ